MKVVPYTDLLRKPFELGARGPEHFDCLGLAYEVLRRVGKTVPPDLTLGGYGDVRSGARLASDTAHRWKRLGDAAGSATELGDIVYAVSADGRRHHVYVLVFAAEPRIVLTTSQARGVHALALRRIGDVVGVYRLPEAA